MLVASECRSTVTMQALGFFHGNSSSDATFAIIISSRGPIESIFESLKICTNPEVFVLGFLSWETFSDTS